MASPLQPEDVSAAVYANSFRTLTRSLSSTGLRTHAVRYDRLTHHGHSARSAEEFLISSRLRRRDIEFEASVTAYFSDPAGAMLSRLGNESRAAPVVALPAPEPMRMATGEAIRRRRSVREYTGDSMALKHLATLAASACKVTGSANAGDGPGIALRSTASGGALYPIELYVAALGVDDLARRIYGYDARRHELFGVAADVDRLLETFIVPEDVVTMNEANAIFLLVARPWRSMRKYGPRGMRHVFLEAGAMGSHLHLACTALGFGSVDCSSVYDDEAHEALGIDGVYEALVHTVIVGVPG